MVNIMESRTSYGEAASKRPYEDGDDPSPLPAEKHRKISEPSDAVDDERNAKKTSESGTCTATPAASLVDAENDSDGDGNKNNKGDDTETIALSVSDDFVDNDAVGCDTSENKLCSESRDEDAVIRNYSPRKDCVRPHGPRSAYGDVLSSFMSVPFDSKAMLFFHKTKEGSENNSGGLGDTNESFAVMSQKMYFSSKKDMVSKKVSESIEDAKKPSQPVNPNVSEFLLREAKKMAETSKSSPTAQSAPRPQVNSQHTASASRKAPQAQHLPAGTTTHRALNGNSDVYCNPFISNINASVLLLQQRQIKEQRIQEQIQEELLTCQRQIEQKQLQKGLEEQLQRELQNYEQRLRQQQIQIQLQQELFDRVHQLRQQQLHHHQLQMILASQHANSSQFNLLNQLGNAPNYFPPSTSPHIFNQLGATSNSFPSSGNRHMANSSGVFPSAFNQPCNTNSSQQGYSVPLQTLRHTRPTEQNRVPAATSAVASVRKSQPTSSVKVASTCGKIASTKRNLEALSKYPVAFSFCLEDDGSSKTSARKSTKQWITEGEKAISSMEPKTKNNTPRKRSPSVSPTPSSGSSRDPRTPAKLLSTEPAGHGLPDGWIKKTFQRNTGQSRGHTDKYFYSPQNQIKFRSLKNVRAFIDILNEPKISGNESSALQTFKIRGHRF